VKGSVVTQSIMSCLLQKWWSRTTTAPDRTLCPGMALCPSEVSAGPLTSQRICTGGIG
jgi:hypothetical protein